MLRHRKMSITVLSLFVLFVFTSNLCKAQEYNLNNPESTLTVLGTSSLHDWHIVAEKQSGKIAFNDLEACDISKCSIEVVAESLKSGKSSMDKNTYKALKTDDFKTITFVMAEVKGVESKGNGKFTVKSLGDLTITGVKRRINLDFNVDVISGKISLSGEKKIKMTDFNIDPPKALFGTITTGDDLTIKFSTTFK